MPLEDSGRRENSPPDTADPDIQRLLHELQVHQVELELQNRQLCNAGEQIKSLLDEFTDLYDFAPLGYLTLGRDGIIKRANLAAAKMLDTDRTRLAGQTLMHCIAPESRHAFGVFLTRLAAAEDSHVDSCEITLRRNAHPPVHVQVNAITTEAKQAFRVTLTDISAIRKLEAERDRQAQRIRDLSHRLVALQEAERRTLGTELHDRTSGNLAALDLLLRDLAGRLPQPLAGDLTPVFDDIQALLLETTRSIREISTDIRPAMLDHAGLIPALEEYATKFTRIHGIQVKVTTTTERRLALDLESVLFRIVQEALTNCAKHSYARTVRIALTSPANRIVLSIVDDGYGFLPETLFDPGAEPGLGILSMKERAEFAGGEFALKSSPGKGTQISVKFTQTPENPVWQPRLGDRRKSLETPEE